MQDAQATVRQAQYIATHPCEVRRRLRYETWFLVHLLSYIGVFLTWFHQLPTGNDFLTNPWAVRSTRQW